MQFEYNYTWIGARQFLKDVFDFIAKHHLPYSVFKIYPTKVVAVKNYHPALDNFNYANYLLVRNNTSVL